MIIGHGIDLQEISRVEKAYKRNPAFAKKVLTDLEFGRFVTLKGQRQMEYLAGRWSGNEKGAPIITSKVFLGNTFVSISHSGGFVQASVILEEN